MSKNLEKEYREFTNQNAPDLWERIVSGLEEKESAAEKSIREINPAERVSVSEKKEALTAIEGGVKDKKAATAGKRRLGRYRIWGVAACLCLAVTGLGLRNQFLPRQEMSAEGADGAQLSGSAMNGGADGLMASIAEENGYEAMDGIADSEGWLTDNSVMAEENVMDWAVPDSVINSAEEPNYVLEVPREDAAGGEAAEGEFSAAVVLQVTITSVTKLEDQDSYTAEVRASEDLSLREGDRITLYEGRSGGEALKEGGIYVIYALAVTETGGETVYRLVGTE